MTGRGKRAALVFVAAVLAGLLIFLPLRTGLAAAGLDDAGLAARDVRGSLWHGRLAAAQWRGLPLGDLEAGVAPLALLTGRMRIDVAGERLRGSAGSGGISGVSGRIGPVMVGAQMLQAVDFDAVDIGFDDGQCTAAAGRVTVQPGGVLATAGALAGVPRCDGRFVVLPLVSAGGETRLELRIAADGSYRAVVAVEPVDEAARPGLLAAGFAPTPQGVAMSVEGVL